MNPPSSDDLLIARLIDLPAAERAAFWDDMCAAHPGLRERSPEVARLLASNGNAAPTAVAANAPSTAGIPPASAHELGKPEAGGTQSTSAPLSADAMAFVLESALGAVEQETPDTRIGHYKLLQKIGEGGFGSVWMADQLEPVRRRVALKIVKIGMDTEEVIARFEAERQALALMDHPNIARVFDAGATASGRPYFVMELVRGVPITRYCDENRLKTEARLQLFVAVCRAVQHAHQKGVIHRDLKPSNILVTMHDGVPVPKIIDFGIAKATDRKLTEKTLVTQFHAFVGTPVYTSPEQMEMSGLDVDTRSDIYSLGVLLYELLAGRPPFDPDALVKSGLDAMRRTIREVDPPRPSHRLGTLTEADRTSVAHQRGTDAAGLTLLLRGDVDWIVMHCLEKDRTRRYDTANGLARDIERHLQHEPVSARPPSTAYRVGKFVRRHRLGVIAGAALVLSLLAGLIASSTLFVRERAAHDRASAAEQAESRLRQQAETARNAEAKRASRTSQALAEQLFQDGKAAEALAHLVRAARSDPENYAIGLRLMSALAYRSFPLPVGEPIADVDGVGYLKDGRHLWIYRAKSTPTIPTFLNRHARRYRSLDADGIVEIRDLADGKVLHSFHVEEAGCLGDSPDGRRLAVGRADGSVTLLNALTGQRELGPVQHGGGLNDIVFSPDGRWLGTAGADRTAKIWDAATGALLATLPHERAVAVMNFSPDSRRLVTTTGSRGHWRVWSVPEGKALSPSRSVRTTPNFGVFSPDGSLLVVADNRGAQVAEATADYGKGKELDHVSRCLYAEFSADGKLLATPSDDATVGLWEMPSGKPYHVPLQHGAGVVQAHFTPDSRYLLTTGEDGMARVWNVRTGRLAQEPVRTGQVRQIDVTRDGREFLTLSRDRTARRWQVAPQSIEPLWLQSDPDRLHIQFPSDSSATAWTLYSQCLQRLDLLTGRNVGAPRPLPVTIAGKSVLAPDARFACVHLGATNREIWDLRGAEIVRHPIGRSSAIIADSFSPDCSRFAATDATRNLRVWDTATGNVVLGPVADAGIFAFAPDSHYLVVSMGDGTAALWNLVSAKIVGQTPRQPGRVNAVAYSPDGSMIATGTGVDVQFWDGRTLKPIGPRLVQPGIVRSLMFSRDNRRVLTCGRLEARVWDVATGSPLSAPMDPGVDGVEAVLTDDGTRIATWSRAHESIRFWDSESGQLLGFPTGDREDFLGTAPLVFIASGRLVAKKGGFVHFVWPVPPPAIKQPVPGWLLRLATAVAGGEIDANVTFRERPFDAKAFDEVRRELAALPADAPLAEWGRWFLADRATRPIGPGFKITVAEAEQLNSDTFGSDLIALNRRYDALARIGRYGEAVDVERQVLELVRARDGKESRAVSDELFFLASTLIRAGQASDAEPVARDCLAMREKVYAAGAFQIPSARRLIGWSLLTQKRYAEAEPLLLSAYEEMKLIDARVGGLKGVQQGGFEATAGHLADVYDATQQPAKAAEWRQKATPPLAPAPVTKP